METSKGVTQAEVAAQIEASIERFHDAMPQGQGEAGDGGAAGRALCQLFYDHSEAICEALRAHTVDATDGERFNLAAELERLRRLADPDGRIALPIVADEDGRKVGIARRKPEELLNIEAHVDESGTVWMPPTACAYMAACRSRQPAAEADEVETFASIIQWGDETFGHATPERVIERAGEEWDEMLEPDADVPTEAADVIIVLLRMPGVLDALQRKMAVNRSRKWDLKGDGTGYHIPAARTALNRADNAEGGLDLLDEGGRK